MWLQKAQAISAKIRNGSIAWRFRSAYLLASFMFGKVMFGHMSEKVVAALMFAKDETSFAVLL